MTEQLRKLAEPFPDTYVHENNSGYGHYVSHHVIAQALLATVGPYDFEVRQVLRGYVPETTRKVKGKDTTIPALEDAVVGVICRLTTVIDGEVNQVEDVGDCEDPHNWPHDGARMKDAISDALKRCASRRGLGLHLWAGKEYFLDRSLAQREQDNGRPEPENGEGSEAGGGEDPAPSPSGSSDNGEVSLDQLLDEAKERGYNKGRLMRQARSRFEDVSSLEDLDPEQRADLLADVRRLASA